MINGIAWAIVIMCGLATALGSYAACTDGGYFDLQEFSKVLAVATLFGGAAGYLYSGVPICIV